jgi:hypothetical protein
VLYQDSNGACGAFAVGNALIPLKIEFNISEIKRIARTTEEKGTSKRGIIRVVLYYGLKPTVYETYSDDAAWKWMLKWSGKTSVISLFDNRGHWVTTIGRINNQVILADPSDPEEKYENSVLVLDKRGFMERWKWGGRFYAIRVTK